MFLKVGLLYWRHLAIRDIGFPLPVLVPAVVSPCLVSVYFLCRNRIQRTVEALRRVQNQKIQRVLDRSHFTIIKVHLPTINPGYDFHSTLAGFGQTTPFHITFSAYHGVFSFYYLILYRKIYVGSHLPIVSPPLVDMCS